MLWESTDPGAALDERFGFATTEAASDWVTATLSRHWGIEVTSCERIVLSFANALAWIRTSEGPLLAKWSIARHRFARLAALAELTGRLDEHGLPVSAPIPAQDHRRQVEVDGVSLGVQRQLRGEWLDVADPGQVAAAGAMLARLHEALAAYDSAKIPELAPPDRPLPDRIGDWLGHDHPHLPSGALAALERQVNELPAPGRPAQLVHGDFRAANLLMNDRDVAAVLDFEDAAIEHRIVELARSAVLLGTRFHDWGPVTPQVRETFLEGYRSVCRLTDAELSWWGPLVLWFSLAMVPPGDDPTGWADEAATVASCSLGTSDRGE